MVIKWQKRMKQEQKKGARNAAQKVPVRAVAVVAADK
jgi:hypothetical protein